MELVSRAADCFCTGDLIETTIRSRNSWNLLPVQAMFSSVLPGEYMSGYMQGQIQFPSWFGKYSKQKKLDRITQELQVHTRLR
jgi:replication factor C subunit 1